MSNEQHADFPFGRLEISFEPTEKIVPLGHKDLLRIAEAAECRNTGWPIGVTMTRPELAPRPVEDGIEAVLTQLDLGGADYWKLFRDGKFFFMRQLEEDERMGLEPKKFLAVDTKIWRIAEGFLYLSRLGRELNLTPTSEVVIRFLHDGLKQRELTTSNSRRHISSGYICRGADKMETEIKTSLTNIHPSIKEYTHKVASELFQLFDFFSIQRTVCDGIVEEFLTSKV